jgi:adenylate cyclase
MGFVRLWQKRHDLAGSHYERGLELNPSDVLINYDKANWLTYGGKPEEGLALVTSMQARDPFPPTFVFEIRARALFHLGRYAEALADFERISGHHVWSHWWRAATYVQLGRMEEARAELKNLLAEQPDVTISFIRSLTAYASPGDCQALLDSLRAAGLPEQ